MPIRLLEILLRFLDQIRGLLRPRAAARTAGHLRTGQRGEDAAYFYLRRKGYVIVARNYRSRSRRGEVDLIGWDGEMLCFIEVKTRTTRDVKPAEAAVDREKQDELRAMAREYWRRVTPGGAGAHTSIRFDIVSVYWERLEHSPEITLFKNAFTMT